MKQTSQKKRRAFQILIYVLVFVLVLISIKIFFWNEKVTNKPTLSSTSQISFLFHLDNELWLGQFKEGEKVPSLKKLIVGFDNQESVSPDRTKIAYLNKGYLKVYNLARHEEKELHQLFPQENLFIKEELMDFDNQYVRAIGSLSWSPEGERIAFVSAQDKQADLYIIDINGENLKRLTHDTLNEFNPVWSPDGKKIAFQTTKNFGTGADFLSTLVVINVEKGDSVRLAENGKLPDGHQFGPAQGINWINNKEFVFYAWNAWGVDGIWKANVMKKKITPLTTERGYEKPEWSPQAEKFAFPLKERGILLVNAKGETSVIDTPGTVYHTSWSKDGDKILLSVDLDYSKKDEEGKFNYELFVVNKDGSSPKEIVKEDTFIGHSLFSADSQKIIYTKRIFSPGMHTELWKKNINTMEIKKISVAEDIISLHLTPYGNYFIYTETQKKEDKIIYITYFAETETGEKEMILMNKKGGISPIFINN
ncbi:MAG: hypothetical protein ACE5LC_07955 [Candidatus Aminicenantales bacterium]